MQKSGEMTSSQKRSFAVGLTMSEHSDSAGRMRIKGSVTAISATFAQAKTFARTDGSSEVTMARSFTGRAETAELTEEAADALICAHAGRAYWVARQKSWEADSEAKSQYWSRVAMRIFLKSSRRFG